MTRRFKWDYKTAHELGESHVSDDKKEQYYLAMGIDSPLEKPIRVGKRMRSSERENRREARKAKQNYLLGNIYS